jgi:Na+/H+ antiporter NhaC
VIPIAIWTKQVLPGLTVGLILGAYLIEPTLLGGIKKMITTIVTNLEKENNIRIIIFLYAFSGLVGIIKMSGGIKGFAEAVSQRIKTKGGALFLTWVSTIGTFSDPDFRIVTIAPIMKSLLKRVKMSAQELGFVIETTANPVVALIPFATAFVG